METNKPFLTFAHEVTHTVHIDGLEAVIDLLRQIVEDSKEPEHHSHRPSIGPGARIVYIVPDSQPPVNYAITGVSATDAKGQPVADAALTYVAASTDDAILTVTPDPTDQTKGTVTFGNEGLATLNITVEDSAGTVLGSLAANFTVTAGPVSAISGGAVAFDGLTETAAAPPAAPTA